MTSCPEQITRALSVLPSQTWVLTAGYESKRSGLLVERVMQCSTEPVMLCVAAPKGHRLATLIRDSRHFGLNLVERSQKLIMRKFDPSHTVEADPFDALEVQRLVSPAPILGRAVASFDCEVVRHFDLEADCELYVGLVLGARTSAALAPSVNGAGTIPGRDARDGAGSMADPVGPAARIEPDVAARQTSTENGLGGSRMAS